MLKSQKINPYYGPYIGIVPYFFLPQTDLELIQKQCLIPCCLATF